MPKLDEGLGHLEELVRQLKAKSYAELSDLPPRWDLTTPQELRGLVFAGKKTEDAGAIEITVRVKKRVLFLISFILQDGFRIFPDGKIEDMHPASEEA